LISINDFLAYMPQHMYLFMPTRELWPAASVNGRVPMLLTDGKRVRPTDWIDANRPVEQMTWHPGEPEMIDGRVMQISGFTPHPGARVFNLYKAPDPIVGDARLVAPWREHLERLYPDDAGHIERWLAHRVQFPGVKINHALVLGGEQGIGKDTVLEPVKAAIGPWNWHDISPVQMIGRFNGWAKSIVLRISETRDLGDVDRCGFYEHCKVYMAAPPDVLRVDEKNLREHYILNVCGVIITSNHKTDGLYIPAGDRRHFVAWSSLTPKDFPADYWPSIYGWFAAGGAGHVAAYLRSFDLRGFDCKAPPPKTPAFWAIVQAGEAPESGELRDIIEALETPDAVTLTAVITKAQYLSMTGLADELSERKNRRAIPHRLERIGYVAVRNPDADDGLFKIVGRRQVVYARKTLNLAAQVQAARSVR
jgi:hypothetical protein